RPAEAKATAHTIDPACRYGTVLPAVLRWQLFTAPPPLPGHFSLGTSAGFPVSQAAISMALIVASTFFPCWPAVRSSDASLAQASAPFLLRLPPLIFRATTAGRSARSATLFVPSRCLSHRNAVSSFLCFRIRLARRLALGSSYWAASSRSSRVSSRQPRDV